MSRYIDADIAKTIYLSKSAGEQLDRVPTADVQEVRHGKWINIPLNVSNDKYGMNKYNLRIKCSECGYVTTNELNWLGYCPNCGAKTDGE